MIVDTQASIVGEKPETALLIFSDLKNFIVTQAIGRGIKNKFISIVAGYSRICAYPDIPEAILLNAIYHTGFQSGYTNEIGLTERLAMGVAQPQKESGQKEQAAMVHQLKIREVG